MSLTRPMTPQQLEEAARPVFARWSGKGLVAAFLYGSFRDGRSRPDSDVDVAILDSKDSPIPWDQQAVLLTELEGVVGDGVDLQMIRGLDRSHQYEILFRGLPLWITDTVEKEIFAREVRSAYESGREAARRHWAETLEMLARGTEAR